MIAVFKISFLFRIFCVFW